LRIECFDISHTMGEATQGPCVVYHHHKMQSAEYRRYNITGITPGDDYAAMRQVSRAATRRCLAQAAARPADEPVESQAGLQSQEPAEPQTGSEADVLNRAIGRPVAEYRVDRCGKGQVKSRGRVAELGLDHGMLVGVAKGKDARSGSKP